MKTLLPGRFRTMVSSYRSMLRNRARSQQLLVSHSRNLSFEHIRNLQVLPTRRDLLERLTKDGVVAEVGVASGEFSRQILDVCRPRRLHLIDLWERGSDRYGHDAMESTLSNVGEALDSDRVQIHRGYSWDMLATLPDSSLDWVYIDAAHDYESVARDLSAALSKVVPQGIIAGHDYTLWNSKGQWRWGVVEAVNNFCIEQDWEMIYLTHEADRHLSYAIRRR